jgi:nucleotide-binding universal stress UspA family protein
MNGDIARPVVVGVDGSEESDVAAVRGAWEADRRGASLRLVHGYTVPVPYTSMGFAAYPTDTLYPMEQAKAMLAAAAERVRGIYPALSVHTALVAGSPAGILVDESSKSSLVVVGSRGHGGFAELLLGSVSAQLAAHSRAPVIVVRTANDLNATGAPPHRPVVIGVDGLPGSDAVVNFGFEQAAALGVGVIAVYVWWMLPRTNLGPTDLRHYDAIEAAEEARRMLAEALAGWSQTYPDVPVEALATHDMNPLLALLDASERSGLVVIGRHSGNSITRLVLGSVGDALIRQAPCPVAVVPGDAD